MARLLNPTVVFALLGAVMGCALAIWRMTQPGLIDFQLFWYIAHGHVADAYDPLLMSRPEAAGWAHQHEPLPFPYPPPAFVLLAPLRWLPWRIAFCLWSALQTGLFGALAYRMLGGFALLPLMNFAVIRSAYLGQTGLLMTDLVMAAFLLMDKRPILGGVLAGLAGAIKPQSALAAPFTLWRSRRMLVGMACGGGAICVLSLIFGPAMWGRWIEAAPAFSALHDAGVIPKIAPATLIHWAPGRLALAAVGLAFAAWVGSFEGCIVGTVLATPYLQVHDLAGVAVLGTSYIRQCWTSRAMRDVPMTVVGVWMLICPFAPLVLLGAALAVMGSKLLPSARRRRAPAEAMSIAS